MVGLALKEIKEAPHTDPRQECCELKEAIARNDGNVVRVLKVTEGLCGRTAHLR